MAKDPMHQNVDIINKVEAFYLRFLQWITVLAATLFAAVGFSSPSWASPFDQFDQYKEGQQLEGSDGKIYSVQGGVPRETASRPELPRYSEVTLGRGPHVLLISKRDGAMTRMNYPSGEACRVARDSVRKQVEPPPLSIKPIIDAREPSLTAVCVPQ
jgi:hypothetical protein